MCETGSSGLEQKQVPRGMGGRRDQVSKQGGPTMLGWQGSDALTRSCDSTGQMETVFHADIRGAAHELPSGLMPV